MNGCWFVNCQIILLFYIVIRLFPHSEKDFFKRFFIFGILALILPNYSNLNVFLRNTPPPQENAAAVEMCLCVIYTTPRPLPSTLWICTSLKEKVEAASRIKLESRHLNEFDAIFKNDFKLKIGRLLILKKSENRSKAF